MPQHPLSLTANILLTGIGQYHVRDVDERRIREYSREIGADGQEMVQAFWDMPKITTERFEKVLNFLWVTANEISNMGYLNLQRRRQTEELESVRASLVEHQLELEENVKDRTSELLSLNKQLRSEIAQKNIMQKMQSRLNVDSKECLGTEVRFILPL